MTTELDALAKKNTKQKLDAVNKKQQLKIQNLKAARKANKADPDEQGWTGSKRSKSIGKEIRKVQKSEKWFDKQYDKLEEHGAWSKENKKGSTLATLEKMQILKKGFPSKAKMDIDVHIPYFPRKANNKNYNNKYKKKLNYS